MARLEFAAEVFDDSDRFLHHMVQFETQDGPVRIGEMVQAIQILVHSPLIGRPVKGGKRELVIGRGSRGYVALCLFVADIDTVFVLAIRSQLEAALKRNR